MNYSPALHADFGRPLCQQTLVICPEKRMFFFCNKTVQLTIARAESSQSTLLLVVPTRALIHQIIIETRKGSLVGVYTVATGQLSVPNRVKTPENVSLKIGNNWFLFFIYLRSLKLLRCHFNRQEKKIYLLLFKSSSQSCHIFYAFLIYFQIHFFF